MAGRLADYAVGNAVPGGRSGVDRVSPELASRVEAMAAAMPPDILARFSVISGFRDAARQAQVNPAVKNSRHMHGEALDLGNDPQMLAWVDQNGGQFGVGFPLKYMPHEQNHLEMLNPDGSRAGGGGGGAGYATPPDPGFKSGLGNFGVAQANLPQETVPMPAIPAPAAAPEQPAPVVDPELLKLAMRGPSPFARAPGLPTLGATVAPPAPAEDDQPRPIVGMGNPLSRRLR